MLKAKIILCSLATFIVAIPVVFNPLLIKDYPQPQWYDYLILFLSPIVCWWTINFGLKKMKEEQLKNNNS